MSTSAYADEGQGEQMRLEHSSAEKFEAEAAAAEAAAAEAAAAEAAAAAAAADAVAAQAAAAQDVSGNGANAPGPYTSTADGTPSANGNGNGNAFGRPCAGCVGNADNKNPPGQLPGPSDPNAGYECDTNSGIARGNPAHSPCVEAAAPPLVPEIPVTPVIPTTPAEVAVVAVQEAALARTGFDTPGLAVIGSSLVLGGLFALGIARLLQSSHMTRRTNRCARRAHVARGVRAAWLPHPQLVTPVVGCGRRGVAGRDRRWHPPVSPIAWRAGSAAHHRRAIGARL